MFILIEDRLIVSVDNIETINLEQHLPNTRLISINLKNGNTLNIEFDVEDGDQFYWLTEWLNNNGYYFDYDFQGRKAKERLNKVFRFVGKLL